MALQLAETATGLAIGAFSAYYSPVFTFLGGADYLGGQKSQIQAQTEREIRQVAIERIQSNICLAALCAFSATTLHTIPLNLFPLGLTVWVVTTSISGAIHSSAGELGMRSIGNLERF